MVFHQSWTTLQPPFNHLQPPFITTILKALVGTTLQPPAVTPEAPRPWSPARRLRATGACTSCHRGSQARGPRCATRWGWPLTMDQPYVDINMVYIDGWILMVGYQWLIVLYILTMVNNNWYQPLYIRESLDNGWISLTIVNHRWRIVDISMVYQWLTSMVLSGNIKESY